MKTLKIFLFVIVLGAIGAGIFSWTQTSIKIDVVKEPENQFTAKIEQEINQLKEMPDNKFCKDFYKEVTHNINIFYEQSKFSSNQSQNDQSKKYLEKNLYAAYVEKFIKQAKTVFRGSHWETDDLTFIQAEKNELKRSKLLVARSSVDDEFTTIQKALDKYKEINGFISSCNGFSYSGSSLSDRFPTADVQSKIQRAESLRQKGLENIYVNNCTRLHDRLKEIPLLLFNKHVSYLDNKIEYWSDMWCNFSSHKDYSQNLNTPLKNEINDLGNSTIYSGLNVDAQYNRLSGIWSADNQNAYNATYPCN